jgi:hypothetical protein
VNRNAYRHRLDLEQLRGRILCSVELVDDDYRARPAVPGRGQIPLEPPWVEVEAERSHEEHRVDVGRYDLCHGPLPRLLARERGTSRQDSLDHRLAFAVDRPDGDPVPDGGQLLLGQLPRGEAAHGTALGEQLARPVVTRGDARRNQVVCCVWLERVCEERVPAEVLQVQAKLLWLKEHEKAPLVGANG